jgi:hypothetical protein
MSCIRVDRRSPLFIPVQSTDARLFLLFKRRRERDENLALPGNKRPPGLVTQLKALMFSSRRSRIDRHIVSRLTKEAVEKVWRPIKQS